MNTWTTAQKKVREVEAWGDAFTPACACGCGEPVPVTLRGRGPAMYVNHQHSAWVDPGNPAGLAKALENRDRIPVEKVRAAIRKLKETKGMSNPQIADAMGISHGQFNDLMYGKNRVAVERETAEQMLRRLAGLSAKPSKWQKRQARKFIDRDNRARRETAADTMPRTRLHSGRP